MGGPPYVPTEERKRERKREKEGGQRDAGEGKRWMEM